MSGPRPPRAIDGILDLIFSAVSVGGGESAMSFRVCADGTATAIGWDVTGELRQSVQFVRKNGEWRVASNDSEAS